VALLSSLSSLPVPAHVGLPAPGSPIPGLKLTTRDVDDNKARYHELTAATARGYCIARKDGAFNWSSGYGGGARSEAEDLDLDRLLEKEGTVILERTRVHFDPPSGTITATGRSQVALTELARSRSGVVVWGYREDRMVILLARGVASGTESHQLLDPAGSTAGGGFVSVDGCGYAGGRLDARNPQAGATAQLIGTLAAQGKGKDKVVPRFAVDASLSRVDRDPEPLLAVRVRMLEP
jgi:hypothetical protein